MHPHINRSDGDFAARALRSTGSVSARSIRRLKIIWRVGVEYFLVPRERRLFFLSRLASLAFLALLFGNRFRRGLKIRSRGSSHRQVPRSGTSTIPQSCDVCMLRSSCLWSIHERRLGSSCRALHVCAIQDTKRTMLSSRVEVAVFCRFLGENWRDCPQMTKNLSHASTCYASTC